MPAIRNPSAAPAATDPLLVAYVARVGDRYDQMMANKARNNGGVAREAPDPKPQYHSPSCHGKIGGKPQVGTMHPLRPAPAARAARLGCTGSDTDADHLAVVLHRHHPDLRSRQEEQLFQPEQYLAHSPEPSARTPPPPAVSRRSREVSDELNGHTE
ncbi:hypothetical protein GCM10010441_13420 [Kitasatospora paracochleata]